MTYEDKPMPFGKYKGTLIADIPNSYLQYLVGEDFFKEKYNLLWKIAVKEVEYRKKFDIEV